MKKIGILTYHFVYNFGANLQALSTQEYLKKQGYEVYIINWIPKALKAWYIKCTPENQAIAHESFFSKYYVLTEVCHTTKEVAAVIDSLKLDAVIIGSDAVVRHFPVSYRYSIGRKGFRKNYLTATDIFPNPYWGSFYKYLKHKIPIAMMSVSAAGSDYHGVRGIERYRIGKAIEQLAYASVRDSLTVTAFSYFTNSKRVPFVTPDPVFSLNQNVDFPKVDLSLDKYIILSPKKETAISKEWCSSFKKICNNHGFKVLALPYPQEESDFEADIKINLPLSPVDWYLYLKNSSGYVGSNMHPVISSLHNSIPVFSFDYDGSRQNGQKSFFSANKIYDLFYRLGITENYCNVPQGCAFIPTPEFVFGRLKTLSKEKLISISSTMKIQYDIMMQTMLKECEVAEL